VALYDTAANILSDVAVEVGLGAVATPYASTDANVVQLRTLLKSTGRTLVRKLPFLQATKEHTLTTTSGEDTYALPADYVQMVDGSGWNRTSRMALEPTSPQTWQALKATEAGQVWTVHFRPGDTTLRLHPDPPATGEVIAFEYRSLYWVRATASAAPDKDAPTLDSDVVHLDAELVKAALKVAFLQAKGFDSTGAMLALEECLSQARDAAAGAAPVLSLTGRPTSERLLDLSNAPLTGFGFDGLGGLG
jgi:hypothetical protein